MGIVQKVKVITVALLAVTISGCMGGGTIGTGVTSLGGGTSSHQSLSYVLSLTVKNSTGKPLSNSRVALSNSAGIYRGVTDAQGKVKLKLTMVSGEAFSIVVSTGKSEKRSEEFISPAGRQVVEAALSISPSGEIEFTELE